jgi:hypothetical protein
MLRTNYRYQKAYREAIKLCAQHKLLILERGQTEQAPFVLYRKEGSNLKRLADAFNTAELLAAVQIHAAQLEVEKCHIA